MRQTMLAPLALAMLLGPACAFAATDLSQPGALDSIREQHPERFQRIEGILRAAERMPCTGPDFTRAMKASHEAEAARCSLALLTSYPAKRQLSFTLDGSAYVATVTMLLEGFGIRPAVNSAVK